MLPELTFNFQNTLGSSRQEVFCEKGVPRNFTKFTGKHLCHSLFVAASVLSNFNNTEVPSATLNPLSSLQ